MDNNEKENVTTTAGSPRSVAEIVAPLDGILNELSGLKDEALNVQTQAEDKIKDARKALRAIYRIVLKEGKQALLDCLKELKEAFSNVRRDYKSYLLDAQTLKASAKAEADEAKRATKLIKEVIGEE